VIKLQYKETTNTANHQFFQVKFDVFDTIAKKFDVYILIITTFV